MQSKLIYKVNPEYPSAARASRLEGTVILNVQIGKDGHVENLSVISATNSLFVESSLNAVQQWVYSTTLLNGEPVAVLSTVTLNYSLTQ
jgi:protein TonB